MLDRIWSFLTDKIIGAKGVIVLVLIALALYGLQVRSGRAQCEASCEAKGFANAIYYPSQLRNGYHAECSCYGGQESDSSSE